MMKSEEWITENFESIVSKYGGKYIGVVNEQVISVALTPREVLGVYITQDLKIYVKFYHAAFFR